MALLQARNEAAEEVLRLQHDAQGLQQRLDAIEQELRGARGWWWGATAVEVADLLSKQAPGGDPASAAAQLGGTPAESSRAGEEGPAEQAGQ